MGKHNTAYARMDKDFYPTPEWCITALAEYVDFAGKRIWECAVGEGHIAEALKRAGAASVYGTDIVDRGYPGFSRKLDFLSATAMPPDIDAIVTNPPGGTANKTAVGVHRVRPTADARHRTVVPVAADRF